MSTITLPSLTQLSADDVTLYRTLFAALLEEYNPQLDLQKKGPVSDLVLHPRAVLSTAHQERLETIFASGSLLEISKDPTIADAATVDRVLSNFRLVRKPGAAATGPVTIVLSSQTAVVIPKGSVFTIRDMVFTTTSTFAARTSSQNVLSPTDRLLIQVSGGWAFNVDVVAQNVGAAGNVGYATAATVAQPPPKFVKAYVGADFVGGQDVETNTQLLGRLTAGLAAQGWSNRAGVEALLRAYPPLSGLKALSLVGFGDPEMLRDRHALWPGSLGGRCDLYLRTDDLKTVVLTKSATLVSKVGAVGTWQFGLTRDEALGYYEVKSILPVGTDPVTGTLAVSSETRGLDVSGSNVPDVVTAQEAVYTRYQTAIIQFVDTLTNATSLPLSTTEASYTVVLKAMPLLGVAQDYLGTPAARPPAGDALVKGPVPCFLVTTFKVGIRQGMQAPATTAIQQAVAAYVNGLGFPGQLTASALAQVVHNLSSAVVSLTEMDMLGRIRKPDGTMITIRSGDRIVVPDSPGDGVTARTVSFFLDAADVAVTLVTVDTPVV